MSLIALVISGLAVLVAWYFGRRSGRRADRANEIATEANAKADAANQIANDALDVAKKAHTASIMPKLIAYEGERSAPGKTRPQERVAIIENIGPGIATNIKLEVAILESRKDRMAGRESKIDDIIRKIEERWGTGNMALGSRQPVVLSPRPEILRCVSIKATFADAEGKPYTEGNIVQ